MAGPVKLICGGEDDEAADRYRAPALDKGLDILEALAATDVGLSQAELAKALDRSASEIYRMLERLVRRGYVVRTESERYELGLKLFALAHQHSPRRRLVSLALPQMRGFVQAAEQSCHMCLFDRGRLIVIAQLDAPTYWGVAIRVGAHVSLIGTGSGHVLLAFQTPDERRMMLDEHEGLGGESVPTAKLEARLAQVRERGYENMPSQQTRGVTNVSFPVLGPDNTAIAALTCPFVARLDPARPGLGDVVARLGKAASALSALAGSQMLSRSGGARP